MFPTITETDCALVVVIFEVQQQKGAKMTREKGSEIHYLREKANQFRDLARKYRTEISPKLLEIADELDERANRLEQRQ